MLVAAAADCNKGHLNRLRESLGRDGIHFLFEGIKPFSWAAMIEWEHSVARKFSSDIVCFVDAWDFIYQGQDIAFLLGDSDILFHSDAHCWPEPHKADLYPQVTSKFRYVNGTGPLGRGEAIAEAIRYGIDNFPIRGREASIFADNDQRFWTDVFLSGIGKIDYDCKLSAPMNCIDEGEFTIVERRLRLNTGVTPAFVHINGGSFYRSDALLRQLL
jgi:hypothetical protein